MIDPNVSGEGTLARPRDKVPSLPCWTQNYVTMSCRFATLLPPKSDPLSRPMDSLLRCPMIGRRSSGGGLEALATVVPGVIPKARG